MLIDIFIAVFLISAVIRGHSIGFVRQFFSAIGFFAGLYLGKFLHPLVTPYANTAFSRTLVALTIIMVCAMALLSLGEIVGVYLKREFSRKSIDKADVSLGGIAGGITFIFVVWLFSQLALTLPLSDVKQAVRRSVIISAINEKLPSAPTFIAEFGRSIYPNTFPEIFTDARPEPRDVLLPSLGELRPAVEKSRDSVVKIEGHGCGGIVEGSGFVVGDGFVATNAHVVAGVGEPHVIDKNGEHPATTVWFNSELDLAVLRTNGLAGKALPLGSSAVPIDTAGAVLGFPGGGGFTAGPASVLDHFMIRGRNIYGKGITSRDVYELKAGIEQGNSGGPLIDKNGNVIGVIFAESPTYNEVGYALTMQQVAGELKQAMKRNTATTSGNCAH